MESTRSFYRAIVSLADIDSFIVRSACIKTIRIIINGGVDHTVLPCDVVPWVSDGTATQVTDASYTRNLFRESDSLRALTNMFFGTVEHLKVLKENLVGDRRAVTPGEQQPQQQVTVELSGTDDEDDDEDDEGNEGTVASTVDESKESKAVIANVRKLVDALLATCLDLSQDPANAVLMCRSRISDAIITLIDIIENPRDLNTSYAIELLWNILEFYYDDPGYIPPSEEELWRHDLGIINFDESITVLRKLFLKLLFEGYRLADKELRNEAIIVLSLVARDPRSVPYFVHSGMLTDLLTYSTVAEVGKDAWPYNSRPMAKLRNFASVFDIDLQLKQEMWNLVLQLVKYDDPAVLLAVASSPFLPVLCQYVSFDTYTPSTDDNEREEALRGVHFDENYLPSTSIPSLFSGLDRTSVVSSAISMGTAPRGESLLLSIAADKRGTASHGPPTETLPDGNSTAVVSQNPFLASIPLTMMLELQVVAINIITDSGHRIMAEFLRINGHSQILAAIDHYSTSRLKEHKDFVFGCVLVLNKCVTYSTVGKKKLEELCAIRSLLRLFDISEEEKTKAQVFRLLSIMCIGSVRAQSQFREFHGVAVLVKAMALFPHNNRPIVGVMSGVQRPGLVKEASAGGVAVEEVNQIITALLNSLRMSVVGNHENEVVFAQSEGIDTLLETIECSPFMLRGLALRVLSELMVNSRLNAFVLSWRSSRTMRNVVELLAHAWMDEEARLNVQREDGLICNIWSPLQNHDWPETDKMREMIADLAASQFSRRANKGQQQVQEQSTQLQAQQGDSLTQTSSCLTDMVAVQASLFGDNSTANASQFGNKSSVAASKTAAGAGTSKRAPTAADLHVDVVRAGAASRDLRGVISNLFAALGLFNADAPSITCSPDGSVRSKQSNTRRRFEDAASLSSVSQESQYIASLSPVDKQVLAIAKRYDTLREGEWWEEVFESLREDNINIIEEDVKFIEHRIDMSFEASRSVLFDQMELNKQDKDSRIREERQYIDQILRQKNQQIKSEWLKKYAYKDRRTLK
jgi:hypothetical protein